MRIGGSVANSGRVRDVITRGAWIRLRWGRVVMTPYMRNSAFLYRTTDDPLGAKPYLWVSTLMAVTPGTRKSNGAMGNPASVANAATNEPRQQSTWNPIAPRPAPASASLATSWTGSMTPWPKDGAEATRMMVFLFINDCESGCDQRASAREACVVITARAP